MAQYFTPTRLSENIRETPEGFLICIGVPIARTGEMIYGKNETPLETDETGQIIIVRSPEEVFAADTLASFEGKPVTIQHPQDFVSPQNWSYIAKGVIQNVRKSPEKDEDGEESLLADLLIMDALAIQLVKAGLREVSCGYEAEYEQISKGKGRQTRIIGNHIALVEQGRAGESYAIQDHKGRSTMSKLADHLKKVFSKVMDEAMAEEKKDQEKKEKSDKKDSKDSDQSQMESKEEPKKDEPKDKMDSASYDELVKMFKDLGEKISAMGVRGKEEAPKEAAKDEEAEGEGNQAEAKIEERLKALEAAVAKLLEMETEENESQDEDSEEKSEDEESEKKEEMKKTGDSKTGLEKTKNALSFDTREAVPEIMTAEKLNEINAAHWARK